MLRSTSLCYVAPAGAKSGCRPPPVAAMSQMMTMHSTPPTARGWPWQTACLGSRSWGQRNNNKLFKGECPCGYTFDSLSTTTRIINHYRFDAYVGPSPGVGPCKFTAEQLSASFPDFWAKRDAYFARKKVQKRGAPSTAPSGQSPLGWFPLPGP